MTNDELADLILPWALQAHPEKYAQTVAQIDLPKTYRRYLLRLVEIRCTEDKAWMSSQVPISVLDETSLTRKLKDRKTGLVLTFGGNRARGITFRFAELTLQPEQFQLLWKAKEALDLEYVPEDGNDRQTAGG